MSMKVYEQKSQDTFLTTSLEIFREKRLNGSCSTDCPIPIGQQQSSGQTKIPALFLKSGNQQTSTKEDTLKPKLKYQEIKKYDPVHDLHYSVYRLVKDEESGTPMGTPTRQPTSTEIQTQAKALSSLRILYHLTKSHK
jgi:hypothetical protein